MSVCTRPMVAAKNAVAQPMMATTTIAVGAARVAPHLVGASEVDKQERIRAVSQQLLSRPVLERTARLEKLPADDSLESVIAFGHGMLARALIAEGRIPAAHEEVARALQVRQPTFEEKRTTLLVQASLRALQVLQPRIARCSPRGTAIA